MSWCINTGRKDDAAKDCLYLGDVEQKNICIWIIAAGTNITLSFTEDEYFKLIALLRVAANHEVKVPQTHGPTEKWRSLSYRHTMYVTFDWDSAVSRVHTNVMISSGTANTITIPLWQDQLKSLADYLVDELKEKVMWNIDYKIKSERDKCLLQSKF